MSTRNDFNMLRCRDAESDSCDILRAGNLARVAASDDMSEWSSSDVQQFAPLERRWTERAKFELTVPELIRRWERFVVKVEQGYASLIEEYQNDLDTRKLLQEAIEELRDGTAQRLSDMLRPWDRRFEAATVPSDPPIWRGGWWAERMPKILVGTLAEDVRRRGLRERTA